MEPYSFDEAYLDRLKERDPATEEHFVSYFSKRLNFMIRAVDRADINVDEIRQETFIRVWSQVSQGNLRHPQSFGSYVSAVCKQVIREKHSDVNIETGDEIDQQINFQHELVRRVLEKLPEGDRKILQARFFEDKDQEEICDDFGVDRDYLRVLFHRAINKFGELYKKQSN
jgi:RNA polymerase sigma-70 factor (ECF subfamily)